MYDFSQNSNVSRHANYPLCHDLIQNVCQVLFFVVEMAAFFIFGYFSLDLIRELR